ncbi:MAG: carbohydrate kinase family protein [Chloroflexi bacterium]|nr:carbohydrate kinase family protein [Chloroflexota bacterium]
MSIILVSGLINVETTVRVDGFPIAYSPVCFPFFGVNSRVSGVGYNLTKALTTLGDAVRFLSLIGTDSAGRLVADAVQRDGIPAGHVLALLPQTAQSAILYDPTGRRQIYVDLKDIQERTYPAETFEEAIAGCALAVLCNINFSRPFLARARQLGIPIATDVHTIGELDDTYNRDFMAAADILFMSDERLPCTPKEWVRRLWNRYGAEIAVVGLGSQGALLGVRSDHFLERVPAVTTRPIVNTIGAGDALFSAFVHFYARARDPYDAICRATVFASYKIGETSAAEGFLTEAELDEWVAAQ